MTTRLRTVLAPVERVDKYWAKVGGSCLGLFLLTLVAYVLGIFSTSGGLVWVPWDAAFVGLVAGFGVGYLRGGLLFSWGVGVAALLGAHANHALVGLSGRPLAERLGYFLRLDGLTFYAVEGFLIGTIAFLAGSGLRVAVRLVEQ